MLSKKQKDLVLKYALQNAVFYSGKASPGAVLGKVLGSEPGLRSMVPDVRREADSAVKRVNAMPLEEQESMLGKIAPGLLEKEVKKQDELPELPHAREGKVVTRFAPCPSGPLNIFQALRAVFISYLYAEKYRGRFILRFEDTDPRNVRPEFYEWIKEDLRNLKVKWDSLVVESRDMPVFYEHCEQLLGKGRFYACTCPAERFRKMKAEKKECLCRYRSTRENMELWEKALKGGFKEGGIVVRHKTSMKDRNPAFRDPPMFRVIDSRHPMVSRRYYMWPLYNFANVIEDHESGVTHVFRGKEHEHNKGIQDKLYADFGWKPPYVLGFGMIYLPGEKVHTRDIKAGIEKGELSGWDDPGLHTIRALLRRGFQPEALRRFAMETGLTKTDIRISWKNLEGINGKIMDPLANRYMVVTEPARISVKGAPDIREARTPLHPDFPGRGSKKVPVDMGEIYISGDDYGRLKNKEFRLIELFNVKKGTYTGTEIIRGMEKIQWVSKPNVKVTIITPEGELSGLGEPALASLKPGTVIQMPRTGFGRVDSRARSRVTVYFAHK